MNAEQERKQQTLLDNGYRHNYGRTARGNLHSWYAPNGMCVVTDKREGAAINRAYQHFTAPRPPVSRYGPGKPQTNSQSEEIPAQEALEASRAQAANDLAGEAAYSEVVAEAETSQLRQQLAEAQAENARLTAGIADMKEIVNGIKLQAHDFAIFSAVSNLNVIIHELEDEPAAPTPPAPKTPVPATATKYAIGDKVRIVDETYTDGAYDTISDKTDHRYQLSADSQDDYSWEESELAPYAEAPKNPVPTRCRVNWNKRGFSSGSYPVLGYSPKKQSYVLNISTDNTKVMPKTVKMADCESVS